MLDCLYLFSRIESNFIYKKTTALEQRASIVSNLYIVVAYLFYIKQDILKYNKAKQLETTVLIAFSF